MSDNHDNKPTPIPRRTRRGRPTLEEQERLNNQTPEDRRILEREYLEGKDLQMYKEDLPADPRLLWEQACWFLNNTVMSVIEAGRRFIVLKQQLGHGNFMAELEERSIEPRTAQQAMKAAQYFSNTKALSHLNSRDKLYALLSIPEEELAELESGGTVLGKDIDEINAMSTRELRDLIRRQREDLERKDSQILMGQEQIHDMEKKVSEATEFKHTEDALKILDKLKENKQIFDNIMATIEPGQVLHPGNCSDGLLCEWIGLYEYFHKRVVKDLFEFRNRMQLWLDAEMLISTTHESIEFMPVSGQWDEHGEKIRRELVKRGYIKEEDEDKN